MTNYEEGNNVLLFEIRNELYKTNKQLSIIIYTLYFIAIIITGIGVKIGIKWW